MAIVAPMTYQPSPGAALWSFLNHQQPPGLTMQILKISDVKARTGLSESSIYRQLDAGSFPQPIRLTAGPKGRRGWLEADINNWLTQKSQEAQQGAQQ
jgi:prophage regulatory protein